MSDPSRMSIARCSLVGVLVLAACGKKVVTDHDFCDRRESAFERAYPESPRSEHDLRVGMCEHGVATEHGIRLDAQGRDLFQRRLACSELLDGDGAPHDVWGAMKTCEAATLSR